MKIFPSGYKPQLDFVETEKAIKFVKETFEKKLADKLSLQKVTGPKILEADHELQDDLAGTQQPVSFTTQFAEIEVIHSLAKWKRQILGKYELYGIYTDTDAFRKDEDMDEIHSICVDQWDWEKVITKEQRTIEFLKKRVTDIYQTLLETETEVEKQFKLKSRLPKKITFISAEKLEELYPELTSEERERKAAEKYGAIFVIGIGSVLSSGKPHSLRAVDYDDWELDGDIIVWDKTRGKEVELSSMGIRVDAQSLEKQMKIAGLEERKQFDFHKGILDETIPLTIGGGIGKSRICMLLLQKAHIGEVQASVWPKHVQKEFEVMKIPLL